MFLTILNKLLIFSSLLSFLACSDLNTTQEQQLGVQAITPPQSAKVAKQIHPIDSTKNNKYPWKKDIDYHNTLINRIPTPAGFTRTQVSVNSFGDWLRHLPLKPKGSKVLVYYGEEKHRQDVHAAVVDIDTGTKDLQQCADAVMRVKAEYHYSKKE